VSSRVVAVAVLSVWVATACRAADLYPLTAKRGAQADAGSGGAGGSSAGGGSAGAGEEDLFVAPDGDDANPGTFEQPLRTLARARDLVRTKNGTLNADLTVYVRGGTYPQQSTLTFGSADSGQAPHYVNYVAYRDERPLITGGRPIRGWAPSDAGSGIYSAPAGTPPFRQLYVNGVKAVRARSPNLGPDGAPNFSRLSGWDKDAREVRLSSADLPSFDDVTGVEMHLMTAWADNTLRLASITSSGGIASVKFQSPEDPLLFVRPNPRLDQFGWGSGRAFYFENALELLDAPGEWYLDETTNVVYYEPRAGEDLTTASVVAPMLETVMSIAGTSTSEQVSYLRFEGLTFAHSNYLRPSQLGFLDSQAGQYNLTADADNHQTVGHPPAGVSVTNANHVEFKRNLFTQLAATGLDLVSGTHDDLIAGNAFTDIGGSGISIGKFTASETTESHVPYDPVDENELCTHETLENNFIDGVGTEFQGACGIAAGYPASLTVVHNEVAHANFTGISVGYGWTSAPNAMTDNTIDYNEIHDVANVLAGGAGISTISNQGPASELQYNYLHDFGTSPWADYAAQGLYLDEGTTGYTVAHNVLLDTPGTLVGPNTGSNTLTDNGATPEQVENTLATAGIEARYADIKQLVIERAEF
jgi:hypothetical protein